MIRYFQQQVLQPSQQVILQLLLQLQPLVYHQLLLTLEQDLMQLFVNNSIGNNAVLAINGTGGGDLLTASAAGTTKFNVNNNGNLQFKGSTAFTTTLTSLTGNDVTLTIPDTDTTDSFCLLTLANCTSAATQYWQLNSNALSPANSTWDVLFGATSTASARFAFINNTGAGVPVASISANATGKNTYLTGDGILQTTSNQSFTLGVDTTGNVIISPLNGAAGSRLTVNAVGQTWSGTTSLTASSLATITSAATLGITATTLNLGNGSAATISTTTNGLTLDSGSNTLTFAADDTVLTAAGLATITAGNLATITSAATLGISSTTLNLGAGSNATLGTTSNATLSLTPNGTGNIILTGDFDSQVLVGATSMGTEFPLFVNNSIGNNAVLAINGTGGGDLLTASASGTTKFTVNNSGTLTSAAYTNAGGILYTSTTGLIAQTAIGTASQCLLGGTTPAFGSCSTGTDDFWDQSSVVLYHANSTVDLLVGGQSTASAKFAVLNVNNG